MSRSSEWKIKIDDESRIQALVVFFWIYPSIITSMVNFGGRLLGIDETAKAVILNMVLGFVILVCLPAITRNIKAQHVMFFMFVVLVCVLSYVMFPQNSAQMDKYIMSFLLSVFPLFFLGVLVAKAKIPYGALLAFSRAVIVLMLLVYLFYSGVDASEHEMGRAYGVLPSLMLVSYSFIRERKLLDLFFTVVGAVFLLMCATRGPILLYCIFMVIQLFSISMKYRWISVALFAAVIIIAGTPLGTGLITGVAQTFAARGFNTRIFEMFLQGYIIDDNGRDYLTEVVMEMAREHPLVGNGILSDRRATLQLSWVSGVGEYVHNIVYELWCDFGFIIGTVLLIVLGWKIIQTYKNYSDRELKIIFMIWGFSYAGKLFMSNSFLEEPGFWLCIGMCFECTRIKRRIRWRTKTDDENRYDINTITDMRSLS